MRPRRLTVRIVTPAPRGSRAGNRVTALRWARVMRELGHKAVVEEAYAGGACDVLVALHARKSHASVLRYRRERPDGPLVVALTGTDLYGELDTSAEARESLCLASRLVTLQPRGLDALPEPLRARARVIPQSARGLPRDTAPMDAFVVCVLGHLRPVKDPFRTARAARLLLPTSRVQVVHAGAALDEAMAAQARAEEAANPRYRWLGERPRREALGVLASSHLMALTSELEGGANVVSEALGVRHARRRVEDRRHDRPPGRGLRGLLPRRRHRGARGAAGALRDGRRFLRGPRGPVRGVREARGARRGARGLGRPARRTRRVARGPLVIDRAAREDPTRSPTGEPSAHP